MSRLTAWHFMPIEERKRSVSIYADLPAALEDVDAAGLVLNNLFQVRDGVWQANVRSKSQELHGYEFGRAAAPGEAVRLAVAHARPAAPSLEDMLS